MSGLISPTGRWHLTSRHRGVVVGTVANGASALLWVLFMPDYLRLLGIDSMSYVGILTSLLALASVADLGLGSLLAFRIASTPDPSQLSWEASRKIRRLLRAALIIAFLSCCAGMAARAPFADWLFSADPTVRTDAPTIAALTVLCMGTRMVESVARNGVVAAGHQARAGLAGLLFTVLRVAGASVLLRMTDSGLVAFAWWNALSLSAAALNAVIQLMAATRSAGSTAHTFGANVSGIHYASGAFATSVIAVLASQSDRLFMQGRITEADMTAYCLAASVLAVRGAVAAPLAQAYFAPLASQLSSLQVAAAKLTFLRFSSIQAALVIPPLVVIAILPTQCLFAYTGSTEVASAGAEVMRWLAIAAVLNTLSFPAFSLERASGRTRDGLRQAGLGCVLIWMVLALLVPEIGVEAGGIAQLLYYAMYLIILAPRALRECLGLALGRWLLVSATAPIVAAAAGGMAVLAMRLPPGSRLVDAVQIAVPVAFAYAVCLIHHRHTSPPHHTPTASGGVG